MEIHLRDCELIIGPKTPSFAGPVIERHTFLYATFHQVCTVFQKLAGPIFQIPACGTPGTLLFKSETTDQENAK